MNYEDILEGIMNPKVGSFNLRLQRAFTRAKVMPAYQALVEQKEILGIPDLQKLPILDHKFLAKNPDMVAIPRQYVTRYCQSSGSNAKPKEIPYSRNDLNFAIAAQARAYVMAGVKKYDKHLCVLAYGPWSSGLICHAAGEVIGLTIAADPKLGLEWHLSALLKHRPEYMSCIPSFLPKLERECFDSGVDPTELGLERIFLVGEIFSSEFRRRFEQIFEAKIFNMYGNTEMGLMAAECAYGGLHLFEDLFFVEIVNPTTGAPCSPGDYGEIVITSLCKEALPMVRYNTHDLSSFHKEECPCGSHLKTILPIAGRGDDMIRLPGGSLYPITLEKAITSVSGLTTAYMFTIEKKNFVDHIELRVEARERVGVEEKNRLQCLLYRSVTESIPVFKMLLIDRKLLAEPKIEIVDPGEISKGSWKMKKVFDLRSSQ